MQGHDHETTIDSTVLQHVADDAVGTRGFDEDIGRRCRTKHERHLAVNALEFSPHINLRRVKHMGRAELLGQIESGMAEVNGDNVCDTAIGEGGDGEESDRTATLSPGFASDWFTDCMPTAKGSASAAVVNAKPSGTLKRRFPFAASGT